MREIGEEVACGQFDILSRSGVPGTLTRVSTGLDTYIHVNVSANIHTHKRCTHKHTQMHFLCIEPTMLSLNWAPTEAKPPLHSPQWTPHIQGDFFNWASPENVSRLAPPKFAWSGPP